MPAIDLREEQSALSTLLSPKDTATLRRLIAITFLAAGGDRCPFCRGGVHEWGHLPSCPLTRLDNALRERIE
jgi:hypothetical protein